MIKTFLCSLLLILCCPILFAAKKSAGKKTGIYASAPTFARSRIEKADTLTASGKYKSAWTALGADDSDYIIAKKVDLCTKYFANTENYTSFAFKDLAKGEDLNTVRLNPGSLELIPYDVEKVVQDYVRQNGETGCTCYALGTYYYEVLLLFGGNWIKTQDELKSLAESNLKKAVDLGFYDARTSQRYANLCMEANAYETACTYYEKSLALDGTNADVLYNYALSLISTGKYDKGVEYAAKAAAAYKDDRDFQLDAYILAVEGCMCMGDFAKAEKDLIRLKSEFPDSYLPDMKLGDVYVSQRRLSEANEAYLASFKRNPENMYWFYQTLGIYVNNNCIEEAESLCRDALEAFSGNASVLGYLYVFLANVQIEAGKKTDALSSADEAEKYFAQAGITKFAESIEQIRQECLKK